jgi:hypothetical protein
MPSLSYVEYNKKLCAKPISPPNTHIYIKSFNKMNYLPTYRGKITLTKSLKMCTEILSLKLREGTNG